MKIGDEVYIHGYIDEIRNNTIIIKNNGGYFGTIKNEIVTYCDIYKCSDCPRYGDDCDGRNEVQLEIPEYTEWKKSYQKMIDCGWI